MAVIFDLGLSGERIVRPREKGGVVDKESQKLKMGIRVIRRVAVVGIGEAEDVGRRLCVESVRNKCVRDWKKRDEECYDDGEKIRTRYNQDPNLLGRA